MAKFHYAGIGPTQCFCTAKLLAVDKRNFPKPKKGFPDPWYGLNCKICVRPVGPQYLCDNCFSFCLCVPFTGGATIALGGISVGSQNFPLTPYLYPKCTWRGQGGLPNTANCALGTIAPCGNVGIEQQPTMNKERLTVYPNPTNTNLTISKLANEQIENIEIQNVLGQKQLANEQISKLGNEIQIDVSRLSNGFYFLKTTDSKGFQRTAKFVKE